MTLSRRSSDALVGLLVLSTLVILVLALIFTQGWNERWINIHMLTGSAQDLNVDTKIFLQGLEVGRVAGVSPLVDPSMGPPKFVARLRLRERYQSGAPLILPVGTTASIQSATSLTGGVFIALQVPVRPYAAGALREGDTIPSVRKPTSLDAISQVADSLSDQIKLVLNDTRDLMAKLNTTLDHASHELTATGPEVRKTLMEVQGALAQLRPTLAQATSLMANADGRLGTLHDSVSATLSETRRLLGHLDSLSVMAHGIAEENQDDIKNTVNNMLVISTKLEHFLDQVSRRPLRMLTGVRPLPPESLPRKP